MQPVNPASASGLHPHNGGETFTPDEPLYTVYSVDGNGCKHQDGGKDPSPCPSRPQTPLTSAPLTIHSAAQRGDVATVLDLLDTAATASPRDRDEDDVTPLHWAAINAHTSICALLLERGAEVDARGGDLNATPLQWAARNGHLAVMHLLLQRGADPTLCDSQGFNTLHLTVHSSAVMPLLLVLSQPAFCTGSQRQLNSSDAQGHTPLMWAAYQGDAISLSLLLAYGSDIHAADEAGLSPLHWAVVKGNRLCIRKLLEAGADCEAKEANGKTPRDMSIELKSHPSYAKACMDCGLEEDGRKKKSPLSERNSDKAILVLPLPTLYITFTIYGLFPWYSAVPLSLAAFAAMHHVIAKIILDPLQADAVKSSKYALGVVASSVLLVGYNWARCLISYTPGHGLANLIFFISWAICLSTLYLSATLSPGYSVLPKSETARRSLIHQLADEGRLNGINFSNCVGVRNHGYFLLFLASLTSGIISFDLLTYHYFDLNAPVLMPPALEPLFPTPISAATAYDSFTLSNSLWASLQLTWVSILLIAHIWQVTRQMTTLEVSNLGRYGFMGGRGGSSMASQENFMRQREAIMSGETSAGAGEADALANGSIPRGEGIVGAGEEGPKSEVGSHHGHPHGSPVVAAKKAGNWLLSIVGLDLYTKGKAGEGLRRANKAGNPFDLGVRTNCLDFWSRGRELGITYESLYDIPEEGFAVRHRQIVRQRRRKRQDRFGPLSSLLLSNEEDQDFLADDVEDVEMGGGGGLTRVHDNTGASGSGNEEVLEAEVEEERGQRSSLHLKGAWEVRAAEGAGHPLEERGALHAHSASSHSDKASHQD
ncbi:hypothetical protein BCV69DRAFT_298870 [Microstroma glucosiphilum]|uniref:Palmitoyltransferase n=1 Tax=Pseudomicrostroma glucosiphilum TaxID=1684307 RepID=A0A316UDE9_9BASI|nr:hypothetical protein BCV69DRAFT_298870 [Pseudomicrostroma glucosiphilum]PWN21085.1 hypothetical protein BCV69DRAFT_298870 [Pseudomicrostroma glucosiphilum]